MALPRLLQEVAHRLPGNAVSQPLQRLQTFGVSPSRLSSDLDKGDLLVGMSPAGAKRKPPQALLGTTAVGSLFAQSGGHGARTRNPLLGN